MAQDKGQAEAVKEVASSPCLCEERVLCAIGVAGSRAGSVAPRPCGHQPIVWPDVVPLALSGIKSPLRLCPYPSYRSV
jgi:hypothetical protein